MTEKESAELPSSNVILTHYYYHYYYIHGFPRARTVGGAGWWEPGYMARSWTRRQQ